MDEFKKDIPENISFKENEIISENKVAKESIFVKENVESKEFTDPFASENKEQKDPKINQDKKKKTMAIMTGSLTAVVAGVVIGMTSYINVRMGANFNNYVYADSTITYQIQEHDMSEKESLKVYIYEENQLLKDEIAEYKVSDFTEGEISLIRPVDPERIKELINNAPDKTVYYRFELMGVVGLNVERKFDSFTVKINEVKSEFNGVDCWCTCGVDHCYNFKMNFVDDYNLFHDFDAYIVDSFGNKSYCLWENDIHSPQKISVYDLVGSKATIYISYQAEGDDTRTEIIKEINL